MIFWELFFTFFKIGLFTFGGGYAMIPMIQSEVLAQQWMEIDAVYNFIAIAESTPGAFAVNIASFIGADQAGPLGAIVATTGLVLPSFIIILVIAKIFISSFDKNRYVHRFIQSVKPVIIGLLLGVILTLVQKSLFLLATISLTTIDFRNVIIFFTLLIVKLKFPKVSPILLIVLAALLGMLVHTL